jgi:hypothetical protein
LDILSTYGEVQNLLEVLRKVRQNAETEFRNVYKAMTEKAQLVGREVLKPRTCAKQLLRDNPDGCETPETYYRVVVFNQYLDHLVEEITNR